jgi:hypothetical protein
MLLEQVSNCAVCRWVGLRLLEQVSNCAVCRLDRLRALRFLPDQNFAIQHRAIWQALRQRHNFGKALGYQLFPARPDPHLPCPLDDLPANAVVLPLNLPVTDRTQLAVKVRQRGFERMRQKERIRLSCVHDIYCTRFSLGNQRLELASSRQHFGIPISHHALCDTFGV